MFVGIIWRLTAVMVQELGKYSGRNEGALSNKKKKEERWADQPEKKRAVKEA